MTDAGDGPPGAPLRYVKNNKARTEGRKQNKGTRVFARGVVLTILLALRIFEGNGED